MPEAGLVLCELAPEDMSRPLSSRFAASSPVSTWRDKGGQDDSDVEWGGGGTQKTSGDGAARWSSRVPKKQGAEISVHAGCGTTGVQWAVGDRGLRHGRGRTRDDADRRAETRESRVEYVRTTLSLRDRERAKGRRLGQISDATNGIAGCDDRGSVRRADQRTCGGCCCSQRPTVPDGGGTGE
jgi:hypothetical protein